MTDMIDGCEKDVGITDVIFTIKYRGQKIKVIARDLLDDEIKALNQMYKTAWERAESLMNHEDESKRPKPNEVLKTGDTHILIEDSDNIFYTGIYYRLGGKKKIADEGWTGIDNRFLVKRLMGMPKRNIDLPITVEVLRALAPKLRDKIVNEVWKNFSMSSEAELKNSTGG